MAYSEFYKKDTLLTIKFKNKRDEILSLNYALLNTDLVDRWLILLNNNLNNNYKLFYDHSKIFSKEELDEIIKDFNNIINFINNNYQANLLNIKSFNDINNNTLNSLHEQFEIFGDKIDNNEVNDLILKEKFFKLNTLIHKIDVILKYENNTCSCSINFRPEDIHESLKDEDYFLITPHVEWGDIYLGYDTLGKNFFNACRDNDVDVIKRKKIAPQKRFSAELLLIFSTNPCHSYYNNVNFYNWWQKNNISEYYESNLKLKDFAFGYIPIANIFSYQINDSTHIILSKELEFSWNVDWNVDLNKNVWNIFDETLNSHKIMHHLINKLDIKEQFNWNRLVWSSFDEVIDIKIINRKEQSPYLKIL